MTRKAPPEDVYTIKQIAERLGISEKTAYELNLRGDIPGRIFPQMSHGMKFSAAVIERYIQTGKVD